MTDRTRMVDWQFPAYEETPERRKGWIEELIQNGDRWLRGQRSIAKIEDDVALLMGSNQTEKVESNSLQADTKTFVETISDLRQIATYGSNAEQFAKHVETYNGTIKHIFRASHFVHKSRKCLQYAMLGRGYMWLKHSRDRYGWGRLRTVFDALGPLEVLPEQLPPDNDIQGAYAVTAIRPMPIAEAHARFEPFQQWLNPISRYDWKSYGTLSMARRLDFYSRWRFGDDNTDWDSRYAEIRYTWGRDLRINRSGSKLLWFPGATWGYEVPSVGDLIVTTNPFNQLPQSRTATEEDCRVYPNLRLIITTPTCPVPLYDGPAFDWHGEIPIVSYDVNDWAWSPLGHSMVRLVAGLERARRELLSKMHEVTMVNLDPPMGYDLHTGVKREQLDKLDLLRAQGYRVGVNGEPKKGLVSILPEEMRVTSEHFKQKEVIDGEILKSLGLSDLSSLRQLKMNVSESNFDKILENLGPLAKGIAETMSIAHEKIAYMLKFSIPQYYTVAQIMSFVGPNGISMRTFDFDPNSLIPSHMPHEDQGKESGLNRYQRAKWFAEQFDVVSTPTQILNVTQMQERMMWMLFLQKGTPVPMCEIMEKLGVENYGTIEGDTLYEKWKNEQIQKLMFEFKAKLLIAKEMQAAGMPPPAEGGPGQGKGGGRPASGKRPPKLEQRGTQSGNPRVLVSQSK